MRIHLGIIGLLLCTQLSAQRLVKEFNPGKNHTFTSFMGNLDAGFVFSANTTEYGLEPWISDGTDSGTHMLKDINTGNKNSVITDFVYVADSLIYFVALDNNQYCLWRTNGKESGTFKVFDLGTYFPRNFYQEGIYYKGKFYFDHPSSSFNEIWSTDGTVAGTRQVYQFNDSGLYSVVSFNEWKGQLYFFATDREHGTEIWTSDGTSAGTYLLKDIAPGIISSIEINRPKMCGNNNLLFFNAKSSEEESYELYCTDGTEAGTKLFKEFYNTPYKGAIVNLMYSIGDYVFFNTNSDSVRAWKTDGTLKNTVPLLKYTKDSARSSYVFKAFPYKNQYLLYLYFRNRGTEIYTCDSHFNQFNLTKDINPGTLNSRIKDKIFIHNNKGYFLAVNSMLGVDIWTTDGTFNNTVVYQEFIETMDAEDIMEWKNRIFFVGSVDPNIGAELYELDLNKNSSIKIQNLYNNAPYPNPIRAGEQLHVPESCYQLKLYNTMGQLVWQTELENGKCQVPEHLSAGLYHLFLDNNTAPIKIILQ